MKKFIPLIITAIALLSACTTKEYYEYYEYYECPEEHVVSTSYIFEPTPNQWHLYDGNDGVYLYSEWNCPAITEDVLNTGIVLAYFWDGAHDNLLPYIRPYWIDGILYSENIRFDVSKGLVTFIIERDDFADPLWPDRVMGFKVVVLSNIYH